MDNQSDNVVDMTDIEIKGKNGGPPRAKFDLEWYEWLILSSAVLAGWIGYLMMG